MKRPKPISVSVRLCLALGLVLAMAGCDNGPKGGDPEALYMKQGYVQAPKFGTVTRLSNGSVRVTGRATPDGRVRLTSDQNRAVGVSADVRGVFQIDLAPSNEGRLYELAMEDDKRLMLSEGHLFVPPQGEDHMVLLRSGAASQAIFDKASLLAVIDYDKAGGLAVSGRTAPDAEVRLLADGTQIAAAKADAKGHYSVLLPLTMDGAEVSFSLTAESARQSLTRKVVLNRQIPHLSEQQQAQFSRVDDGWRIVWLLPGGGTQLSMVY